MFNKAVGNAITKEHYKGRNGGGDFVDNTADNIDGDLCDMSRRVTNI